jgi:hypothetical protein
MQELAVCFVVRAVNENEPITNARLLGPKSAGRRIAALVPNQRLCRASMGQLSVGTKEPWEVASEHLAQRAISLLLLRCRSTCPFERLSYLIFPTQDPIDRFRFFFHDGFPSRP